MFYIKQNFGYAEVITEITDENVYCKCPDCGAEVQVDLAEVFGDGEGDLFGTAICCAECSKKRCKSDDILNGPVTLDGLAMLTTVLNKIGYSEAIKKVYKTFNIATLSELPERLYEKYGEVLTKLLEDEE